MKIGNRHMEKRFGVPFVSKES